MAMADEYLYKISSRYLQKWLSYVIKHVENRGIPWQIDQAITPYISDFDEIAHKWSST